MVRWLIEACFISIVEIRWYHVQIISISQIKSYRSRLRNPLDVTFGIDNGTIGFELGLEKAGAPKKLNPDKADDFFVKVNKSSTSLELQLQKRNR